MTAAFSSSPLKPCNRGLWSVDHSRMLCARTRRRCAIVATSVQHDNCRPTVHEPEPVHDHQLGLGRGSNESGEQEKLLVILNLLADKRTCWGGSKHNTFRCLFVSSQQSSASSISHSMGLLSSQATHIPAKNQDRQRVEIAAGSAGSLSMQTATTSK